MEPGKGMLVLFLLKLSEQDMLLAHDKTLSAQDNILVGQLIILATQDKAHKIISCSHEILSCLDNLKYHLV